MTATNSVAKRTGNVSAGTSVFAMVVMEKPLSKPYEEIDIVTTPTGDSVAIVHCNNCTSDLNAWVSVFREFAESLGVEPDMDRIYSVLYIKHWRGMQTAADFWHIIISPENILQALKRVELFVSKESSFTLANFMRAIYSLHLCTETGLNSSKDRRGKA